MKTPNIKNLVNRYAKCIELRSGKHVNQIAKNILIAEWKGKEKQLYELLKKMENADVQRKIMEKSISIESVTYQTGCDFLGFATYVTHENVFYNNPKVGKGIIEHRQLEFKDGYKVITVTS
jgi:hypothetical protein